MELSTMPPNKMAAKKKLLLRKLVSLVHLLAESVELAGVVLVALLVVSVNN